MTPPTLSRPVTIRNAQGLHLRPADLFVRRAKRYAAEIELSRGHVRVNGKSIIDIMMLAAEQGAELVIYAHGDDAEAALADLAELVESGFAGDEPEAAGEPARDDLEPPAR